MVIDNFPENHKGQRCTYKDLLCQEGFCGECYIPRTIKVLSDCPKWKTCPKKSMVLDKGYDDLELYRIVMRRVCEKCEENK